MLSLRQCVIVSGMLMSLAPGALAQEDVVRITAGVSFPHQAEPGEGLTQPPFSAPGGYSIGWLAGASVRISRGLSVEGELSRTGTMKSEQSGRGSWNGTKGATGLCLPASKATYRSRDW